MELGKMAIPIGQPSFRAIREKQLYYVDKTMFAAKILESGADVTLITRPRRFGKTLNMTMLADFLDFRQDSRDIFQGLLIMKGNCAAKLNTYPVIYLSFKDCKYETANGMIQDILTNCVQQYRKFNEIYKAFSVEGTVLDQPQFRKYCQAYELLQEASEMAGWVEIFTSSVKKEYFLTTLKNSLRILTEAIYLYYNKKPFLLIDEYDTPIIHAYTKGYKKELGDFFTIFYGAVLKDNIFLEKAVLTGIQRVAKENIFSGMNNLHVSTVVDKDYAAYFGLTQEEVAELFAYYERPISEKVREQYDGYCFGGVYVYNPWSIMNFLRDGIFKNYWIATSSNALIEDYLQKASKEFYKDFDLLASQRHAHVSVDIDMALQEFLGESDGKRFSPKALNRYLWGMLVNAGYLTYIPEGDSKNHYQVYPIFDDLEEPNAFHTLQESAAVFGIADKKMNLRIPNGEVYATFRRWTLDWMDAEPNSFIELLEYLSRGDVEGFSLAYSQILEDTISYYDFSKDNRYIYHALFLGMCMTLSDYYKITSNREYGDGRPDIRMESRFAERPHIIVEIKSTRDENCGGIPLNQLKEQALQQIHSKNYYSGLTGEILCLGLAHDGKRCEAICELMKR